MDRNAVASVAVLDNEVRADLYEYVRDTGSPVTREDAASAVRISRKLAAFHLGKLVEAGLLSSRVAAGPLGRVGRAPRVYELSEDQVGVNLPPRDHALLARVLLEAVAGEQDRSTRRAVLEIAGEKGRALGSAVRSERRPGRLGAERALSLCGQVLARQGFQPRSGEQHLTLQNCPFAPLTDSGAGLVCEFNQAYLDGFLRGLAADRALATRRTEPSDRCCCVTISHD